MSKRNRRPTLKVTENWETPRRAFARYKLKTCLDWLLEIEEEENKLQAKQIKRAKSMTLQRHNAVHLQEETPEKQEWLQNMSVHQA